jgi:EAL domain-containing protein (putative c-di-GMP-specific phosphodiesterase class I)/GGDEF domain-containing protein
MVLLGVFVYLSTLLFFGTMHYATVEIISNYVFFLLIGILLPVIYLHSLWQLIFVHPSTKLPNRTKLILDEQKLPNPMLIVININCFRGINEFFGDNAGTSILCQLASRCSKILPKSATLYHISDTELAVLAPSTLSHRGYVCIEDLYLEDFIKEIEEAPYLFQDEKIPLIVTLGVASKRNKLIERAYKALEKGLEEQKSYVVFKDTSINNNAFKSSIQWMKKVKHAIENNQIAPVFQPIINNQTEQTEMYECLVRLEGDKEELPPEIFLKTAKKSRLYSNITKAMIEKSFKAFKNTNIDFSINLSTEDLLDADMRKFILTNLRQFSSPQCVTFEISELESLKNFSTIKFDFDIIKKLGAHIAIDNFGTNCSNISSALELSADYIKIDRSLIEDIDSNQKHQLFVQTIVEFAHKMDIKIIAKFVHSETIFHKVKELGVDYSQGGHCGCPKKEIEAVSK